MDATLSGPERWQNWQEALFLQRNYLFLKALWNSASPAAEHPYAERLAKQLFPNHSNQQIRLVLRIFSQYQELSISNPSTEALCLLLAVDSLGKVGETKCFGSSPWGSLRLLRIVPACTLGQMPAHNQTQEKAALHEHFPGCRVVTQLWQHRCSPCAPSCWGWGATSTRLPQLPFG